MSEYWKSTPKYWCKYCSVYVRDTKIERQNHEATGRHQGAVKRSLRELHRGHEREEREKERARREVDRLNGVTSSQRSGTGAGEGRVGAYGAPVATVSEAERRGQLEQLADLGVAIPDDLRGNMALAGEWTVTSSKVIQTAEEEDEKGHITDSVEATAKGVRKREHEKDEEEQEARREEENAVNNLFKKPRRWGRDIKALPGDEDAELDALLSGDLTRKKAKKEEAADDVKLEEEDSAAQEATGEPQEDKPPLVKQESVGGIDLAAPALHQDDSKVEAGMDSLPAGVVFKKRKAKVAQHK